MLASFLPLVPEHHMDEDVDGYAQDVGYQEEKLSSLRKNINIALRKILSF